MSCGNFESSLADWINIVTAIEYRLRFPEGHGVIRVDEVQEVVLNMGRSVSLKTSTRSNHITLPNKLIQ